MDSPGGSAQQRSSAAHLVWSARAQALYCRDTAPASREGAGRQIAAPVRTMRVSHLAGGTAKSAPVPLTLHRARATTQSMAAAREVPEHRKAEQSIGERESSSALLGTFGGSAFWFRGRSIEVCFRAHIISHSSSELGVVANLGLASRSSQAWPDPLEDPKSHQIRALRARVRADVRTRAFWASSTHWALRQSRPPRSTPTSGLRRPSLLPSAGTVRPARCLLDNVLCAFRADPSVRGVESQRKLARVLPAPSPRVLLMADTTCFRRMAKTQVGVGRLGVCSGCSDGEGLAKQSPFR